MGLQGVVGRVRGLIPGNYAENREDEQFHISPLGDQIITLSLPELTEIVRHGDSWQALSSTYTALTALPTTTGIFGLWNGEPDNGKVYVIDSMAVVKVVVDTTQVDKTSYFVQLVRPPVATPTDDGTTKQSLSGRKTYDGRARWVANPTTVSGRWDTVGTSPKDADALAGTGWQCWDIPLFGKYVVPPGGLFAFHRSEITATANKFRAVIRWHEVRLPIIS